MKLEREKQGQGMQTAPGRGTGKEKKNGKECAGNMRHCITEKETNSKGRQRE